MRAIQTRRTRGGDADKLGRSRAKAMYPDVEPCEVCGKTGRGRGVIDRHHRNSDRLDNSPENIAFLCRRHHHAAHKLTDGRVGGGARPRITAMIRDRAVAAAGEARRMLASGVPIADVAAQQGVSVYSVKRWLRKYPA